MQNAVPLQRKCSPELLRFVMKNPLVEAMRDGIDRGEIVPALRMNEVHFYESGARLLRFTAKTVYTHRQYIDGDGDRERPLRENELNAHTLERMRRKAKGHRSQNRELVLVHKLFPALAVTRGEHGPGKLALIDVEARFAPGKNLAGAMIDLVFLRRDLHLLFIEAKCIENPDVRSKGEAKVACQVRDYERHIKRKGVLCALNRSLQMQSKLVGHDLGQAVGIVRHVPVLVLDPRSHGLPDRSQDKWLRGKLESASARNWIFQPGEANVIDGIRDPVGAIRGFDSKMAA